MVVRRIRLMGLCLVAVFMTSMAIEASASAAPEILAWGQGFNGDLGNGTTTNSDVPVAVSLSLPSGVTVTQVDSASAGGFAVLSSGEVRAWGSNSTAELGDGDLANADLPVAVCAVGAASCSPGVDALTGVVEVSSEDDHSLARLSNGEVRAWGYDQGGQTGNDTETASGVYVKTPVVVCEVAATSCSPGVHALTGVTAISAGYLENLALLGNGEVRAWGVNGDGELGDGTDAGPETCPSEGSPCSKTPVTVCEVAATSCSPGVHALTGVTAISAGFRRHLALLGNGEVRAWGYNHQGQLGNASTANADVPVAVCAVGAASCSPGVDALTGVVEVSGNSGGYGDHSLARLSNGEVRAWGGNEEGQLGNGTTSGFSANDVPVVVCEVAATSCSPGVHALTGVKAISAGWQYSLALLGNGEVRAWGYNYEGQLGNASTTGPEICYNVDPCSKTPVAVCEVAATSCSPGVHALTGITAVSAGWWQTFATRGIGEWYSNGVPIPAGEKVTVATKGELTFDHDPEEIVTCKLTDKDIVTGGTLLDELTEFNLSTCKSVGLYPLCNGETLEVNPSHLPWHTLGLENPEAVMIENMELKVECNDQGTKTLLEVLTGSLTPLYGPPTGANRWLFTTGTGELASNGRDWMVTGFDALEGPPGDEKVRPGPTGPPVQWYSNGKAIASNVREPVATSGELTMSWESEGKPVSVKCTLTDEETVVGGPAGLDEMTAFALSPCAFVGVEPRECEPTGGFGPAVEIHAVNLPWRSHALEAPQSDAIQNMELAVSCNTNTQSVLLGFFSGSLTPQFTPSLGQSALAFSRELWGTGTRRVIGEHGHAGRRRQVARSQRRRRSQTRRRAEMVQQRGYRGRRGKRGRDRHRPAHVVAPTAGWGREL